MIFNNKSSNKSNNKSVTNTNANCASNANTNTNINSNLLILNSTNDKTDNGEAGANNNNSKQKNNITVNIIKKKKKIITTDNLVKNINSSNNHKNLSLDIYNNNDFLILNNNKNKQKENGKNTSNSFKLAEDNEKSKNKTTKHKSSINLDNPVINKLTRIFINNFSNRHLKLNNGTNNINNDNNKSSKIGLSLINTNLHNDVVYKSEIEKMYNNQPKTTKEATASLLTKQRTKSKQNKSSNSISSNLNNYITLDPNKIVENNDIKVDNKENVRINKKAHSIRPLSIVDESKII